MFRYNVTVNGEQKKELKIKVKMAPDNTLYLDSGKGQLYFGKFEGTFIIYRVQGNDPYLKAIFLALPRLPMGFKNNVYWDDYLTADLLLNRFQRGILLFLSSFFHELSAIKSQHVFTKPNTIEGSISSKFWKTQKKTILELDDVVGFKRIQVDSLVLEKI